MPPSAPPYQPAADARVAVVAAGAGARGAFEAGALAVLLPWLEARGLRPTVFVGTSAGAINAALLAAYAHLPAEEAADRLLAFWRETTLDRIIRPPATSVPKLVAQVIGQVVRPGTVGVSSLLDSTPMADYAAGVFAPLAADLRRNIDGGLVHGVALAATDGAQRTRMFCDLAPGVKLPRDNRARGIDHERVAIGAEHVLASSAIPAVFLPIQVGREWFTDGGTRLNVPISPAIELGATDVVVVATHPEQYPARTVIETLPERPDAIESVAPAIASLMSDRMVEDLHTLDKLNRIADQVPAAARTPQTPKRIGRLFAGPARRDELGEVAAHAYAEGDHGLRHLLTDELGLVERTLGSGQPATSEILSYLFFEPEFVDAAITLGGKYATSRTRSKTPWR